MAQSIAKIAGKAFQDMGGAGAGEKVGMENHKKGLLSDEPFAEAMMASSIQNGNRRSADANADKWANSGMSAYQDYSSMGMKSEFNPIMGMSVLNQMRYQPHQRRQIVPVWSKKPWEI